MFSISARNRRLAPWRSRWQGYDDGLLGAAAVYRVAPGTAPQDVVAGAAEQRVVAAAATEGVVAVQSLQQIVAREAINGVITCAAVDDVIACCPEELAAYREDEIGDLHNLFRRHPDQRVRLGGCELRTLCHRSRLIDVLRGEVHDDLGFARRQLRS